MSRVMLVLCCLIGAFAPVAASAAPAPLQRFAVLIAAHDGGEGLPKLRYAARDAQRLNDVLVDVGGFARSDILTVVDGSIADVRRLLDELEHRIAGRKARGDDVVVVVYYSGHASNGRLHLGDERFEMRELRERLSASSADVRLAFVDSCGAGAITREKGAVLAAPFVVKVEQPLGSTGQVIIASSSADEVSQESDDIQGSFFTHHLTTGLRGDADRDHDGAVTLDEAYTYAYGRTVAATAATRAGAQHPTYAFNLQGAGDVVLTRPGGADVVVEFPRDLEGRYFVVDLDRQLFVAELDKLKGGASEIALPRGQYAIKKRLDSHLLITRVHAREKGRIVVDDDTMQSVAFTDDWAKGSPLGASFNGAGNAADEAVSFSFALAGGVLTTIDPTGFNDGGLFPSTAGVGLQARFNNLVRPGVALDVDVGFGGTRSVRIIDGGVLFGVSKLEVEVSTLQAGVAALWLPKVTSLLGGDVVVGVGPHLAGVLFVHTFVGDARPAGLTSQSYFSFNPGIVGVAGWQFSRWLHLELGARGHYMPYTIDAVRHLLTIEGSLSLWVDL